MSDEQKTPSVDEEHVATIRHAAQIFAEKGDFYLWECLELAANAFVIRTAPTARDALEALREKADSYLTEEEADRPFWRGYYLALKDAETLLAETPEPEPTRAQLADAAKAHRDYAVCYRVGRKPSEKLFQRIDEANHVLAAYDKSAPQEDV